MSYAYIIGMFLTCAVTSQSPFPPNHAFSCSFFFLSESTTFASSLFAHSLYLLFFYDLPSSTVNIIPVCVWVSRIFLIILVCYVTRDPNPGLNILQQILSFSTADSLKDEADHDSQQMLFLYHLWIFMHSSKDNEEICLGLESKALHLLDSLPRPVLRSQSPLLFPP